MSMTLECQNNSDLGRRRSERVEQVRERILTGWQNGKRALLEDFRTELMEVQASPEDWHDLILTEIRARRDAGDSPTELEYAERFPGQIDRLRGLFDAQATHRVQPGGAGGRSRENRTAPRSIRIPGYEILGVLGRGGMGVVYRARQVKLNRIVALKMILSGRYATEEDLQRFWREAEAAGAINHPHVVKVFEVGEHEGCPFVSLEFVEGGTLADRMKSGTVPFAEAARLAESVARGAHSAHELGIIHRDLKPANILLSKASAPRTVRNGQATASRVSDARGSSGPVPKITDFGIAKRLNESLALTATGVAAGTPQYMAPEQALARKDQPVGPAADVYSVGAILYELLTGRAPFDGESPAEVLKRVTTEPVAAPSRFNPAIPRDLETICLKCLEREPQRRYASAALLADDLARWSEGKPILARPVGWAEQLWRWCRRNPVVAGLLAGIMFVLLAGAGIALALAFEANRYARKADESAAEARINARQAVEQAEIARQREEEARQSEAHARQARIQEEFHRRAEFRLRQEAVLRETGRGRELYDARMNMAHAAWLGGQLSTTRQLLELYRPQAGTETDDRGFEWYYLSKLMRTYEGMMVTGGMPGGASGIPGSRWWAFCNSRSVIFWDHIGNRYRVWQSPLPQPLTQLAFNADASQMAVAGQGPFIHLQDVRYDKPIRTLRVPEEDLFPAGLAFSPDGKLLHVALGSMPRRRVKGVIVSYDLATGEIASRTEGEASTVTGFSVSGDGKWMAAVSPGGEFNVWHAATGKHERKLDYHSGHTSVAFSPDGSRLAAGSTVGTVGIWNAKTGEMLRVMKGHVDDVEKVAFSADNERIASGGVEGMIRVWDARTGEECMALRSHERRIVGLAFAPTGHHLISTSEEGQALCWDPERDASCATRYLSHGNPATCLLHPDGQRAIILQAGTRLQYADLRTAVLGAEIEMKGIDSAIVGADLSPDGKTLALATFRRGVFLVPLEEETPTGQPIPETGESSSVAFSADGRWLATGHQSGRILLHDPACTHPPRQIGNLRKAVHAVCFDPTNSARLSALCQDQTLRSWNLETGEEFLTLDLRDHRPRKVCYAPNGGHLATAGGGDASARLWHAETGRLVRKFEGHARELTCISFSADGRRLLTGSEDLTHRVWDLATGMPTITLGGSARPPRQALFDSSGTAIISINQYHAKIWDGHPAYLFEQGRTLASRLTIRQAQAEWQEDGTGQATFRLVNETSQPIDVPSSGRAYDRIRINVLVERMGPDPFIPRMRSVRPNESDQYDLASVMMSLPHDRPTLRPGEFLEGNFRFSGADWPEGTYLLHLEMGWGGEGMVFSRATCNVTVPPRVARRP